MEEEDTIIVQAIFKFEDGRLYNLDVDRTTTFYEIKKILSNAAHILKNSFIPLCSYLILSILSNTSSGFSAHCMTLLGRCPI